MKIRAIYDNGGKTVDRYTVYFDIIEKQQSGIIFYSCLGMSEKPFHPCGICQHSSGQLGRHNGKRIELKDLPLDCQKAVYQDLFPLKVKPLKKLKRKRSWWPAGFSNKVYTVNEYDTFRVNGKETDLMLVAKTGLQVWQFELVYPDEVLIVSE
jgi:hypothetical protein